MRCLHYVKIAFLCIPFELLRLEHEQILLDLFWACHKLSSDTIKFHRGKAVKQAEQAFKVAMQLSERKNHNKSFCAIRQLLSNMKDFVKSVIYYLRYVNKGTLSEMNLQENLVASKCDSSVVVSRKNSWCLCVHIIMIVSL